MSGNHALAPDSGDLCLKESAPQAALSRGASLLCPSSAHCSGFAERKGPTSARGPQPTLAWEHWRGAEGLGVQSGERKELSEGRDF